MRIAGYCAGVTQRLSTHTRDQHHLARQGSGAVVFLGGGNRNRPLVDDEGVVVGVEADEVVARLGARAQRDVVGARVAAALAAKSTHHIGQGVVDGVAVGGGGQSDARTTGRSAHR